MNTLKKILSFIIVSILLLHSIKNTAYASSNPPAKNLIKVGVFLVDLTNVFNSDLKNTLEELQKYGFNSGDNSKYIPVVGLGGVPESKKLINQGFMTGTVVQDSKLHAKAIYDVAMNLASGRDPLNNTDYKFDETGITIKIPYYEYVK